jgi:hypothetical protein
MKVALAADAGLPLWTMTDKEKSLQEEDVLLKEEEDEVMMMMMTAEEEVPEADHVTAMAVAGMEIMKAIQKQPNEDGKAAAAADHAAQEADRAETMMMMIAEEEVRVADLAMVMAVAGTVITKDILRQQNVDGKAVVVAVHVVQEVAPAEMMTMMIAAEEVHAADHATEMAVAGTVITKDIRKLLNVAGKVVAEADHAAQEADHAEMMTTMIAVEEVPVADHVMEMAVAGTVIRKDIPKQLNAAGKAVAEAMADLQAVVAKATVVVEEAAVVVIAAAAVTVDGSAIQKVIQKQRNVDGKADVNKKMATQKSVAFFLI